MTASLTKLTRTRHLVHDEDRIYGRDFVFEFEQGFISDPFTHKLAIVEVKLGGELHYEDPVGRLAIKGFVVFPRSDNNIQGNMALGYDPDEAYLSHIATNVAEILMLSTPNFKLLQ